MTIEFKLKFKEEDINPLAEKYKIADENREVSDSDIEALKPDIEKRGYLTSDDLILVRRWIALCEDTGDKADINRINTIIEQIEKNRKGLVKEITAKVFTSNDKEKKIELLVENLHGVKYTVASAILHWFAKDDYPIFSTPALRSCGKVKEGNDNSLFWEKYTEFCRGICRDRDDIEGENKMRTLDRALCQYSSKNRRPRRLK